MSTFVCTVCGNIQDMPNLELADCECCGNCVWGCVDCVDEDSIRPKTVEEWLFANDGYSITLKADRRVELSDHAERKTLGIRMDKGLARLSNVYDIRGDAPITSFLDYMKETLDAFTNGEGA